MFLRYRDYFSKNYPGLYRLYRVMRGLPPLPTEEDVERDLERTVYFRNRPLMSVFNNNYRVHSGPFLGMKYIESSSGSAFLPKIIGSYEEPIQDWVMDIINKPIHHTILNIGCAEGYYAVGFAMKMPQVQVYAYDLNARARQKAKTMIEINAVGNVTLKEECTHSELNERSRHGVLVFCDIEGAEIGLLDPAMVPNLASVDILVESHDCVVPGVTDLLIERFRNTHAIEMVVDYPGRLNLYSTPNPVGSDDYREIINEHRAEGMRWLYLKSLLSWGGSNV